MSEQNRVPFTVAIWLIALPLVIAFFAGAGAGTAFNGFAGFLATLFAMFGGASLIVGLLLLLWVGWRQWKSDKGHA